MLNILVVEDNEKLRQLICIQLSRAGYHVFEAENGLKALNIIEEVAIHLIIADIMMPKMDGYELTDALRGAKITIPVLMVTAKETLDDKRKGFKSGADDYMVKPFNILEVKARIKTILRRASSGKREEKKPQLAGGGLFLDAVARSVEADGKPINLTVKEFDLLQLFMSNPGRVFSREELLETIWGNDYFGDFRTVDVHIRRLREKIEADPAKPQHILTKWGIGYYFGHA